MTGRTDLITVQELEKHISQLSPEELSRLRAWFDEFDVQTWDQQFDADVRSGKLEQLAGKAVKEFKAGNYREL